MLPTVQLYQQFGGLVMPAVQIILYLIKGVLDIDTPQIIIPAIFSGQPHAVQQKAI